MHPDESAFDDYLTRHYAHLGDQARHRDSKKRQLLNTYAQVLPVDRAAAMLEIGPGFGQLLELLRRDRGYSNATAVDLSGEVVEFCNRLMPGSTTLASDTLAFLEANPARFERVFALHVLEHVSRESVGALVAAIARSLRPGGLFVAEVPNMANLFTGNYLRYADPTHECGYTEWSLRHLFEQAGLADVRCFEEQLDGRSRKALAVSVFRGAARMAQRVIYRGYELPVPGVLSPALCAVGARRADAR